MNPDVLTPDVAPLDEARVQARQAHLERELSRSSRPGLRRRRSVRGAAIAAVLLAVAAFVLSGRDGGPDALARARAAVSRGPYLGVALEPTPARHLPLVLLDTHSVERLRWRLELWFDTRKHGRAASAGGCTRMIGPQTRTGCLGSVSAGDPVAFTGALDHYRSALANGTVQMTGSATVRGERAWWLRVGTAQTPVAPHAYALFVAVNQKTGDPIRIELRNARHVIDSENVDVIAETRALPAYVKATTTPPPSTTLTPGRQHAVSGADVGLMDAAKLVPGALWPGGSAAGEPFRRARVITLDDGAKQLELLYGGACPEHCILIKQGFEAGWAPGSRTYQALPDRTILVTGRAGNGHSGRLKIRLEGTSRDAILAAALRLHPIR
jgi:hypothetical protein